MSKPFKEAFPTLQLDEELDHLLETTEVTKISANHDHNHIRIYLRAERLIFKKNIWKIEKAILEQIFQNRDIKVKIIESFELSEQYTPQSLMDVYRDSILDELNAYSVLEYNLLRTATMEFDQPHHMLLTMDETIIAKTRTDEIVEFLEKVVCERCGMNLIIQTAFRKPQESKYRKNSEKQIAQEVQSIIARTKFAMSEEEKEEKPAEEIRQYLNHYLPEDIEVLRLEEAPKRFHARLSAIRKTYLYRIGTGDRKYVFDRKYLYRQGGRLDISAMRRAAQILLGTHDFRSFCSNKRMKKSTVRTLYDIQIQEDKEGQEIRISFTGNGFLYNMVRILTGTLIEIGQGERQPEEICAILQAKNREAAGFTAPPQGLVLVSVEYE